MLRLMIGSAVFSIVMAGSAFAGDTVTVNIPGGATQTVVSGIIGIGLGSTFMPGTTGPSGVTVIPGPGGGSFTISSGFIGALLSGYTASPSFRSRQFVGG